MQTLHYTHPLRCKYQTNNKISISIPNPPPKTIHNTPECIITILAITTIIKSRMERFITNMYAMAMFAGYETLPEASSTSSSTERTFLAKASATPSPSFAATFSMLDLMFSLAKTEHAHPIQAVQSTHF